MQEKIGEFNQEHVGRNSAAFANTIGVCLLKYQEIEASEQYWSIRGLQLQLYQFFIGKPSVAVCHFQFPAIIFWKDYSTMLVDHLISVFNELALHMVSA